MSTITVNNNTSLVLVNTAVYSNAQVFLPALGASIAQLTIRDNAGQASSTNSVQIITTPPAQITSNSLFTSTSNINIQQPFGFVTFSYNSVNQRWSPLDTFGFQSQNTTFPTQQLTVSTIQFLDSFTPATINQMNVSNGTLLLNGALIQSSGGGIANPLIAQTIQASTMILSANFITPSLSDTTTRLQVSGTTTMNFLSLIDQYSGSNVTFFSSNTSVYRKSISAPYPLYGVNQIGGYIEFAYSNDSLAPAVPAVYPLYLPGLSNFSTGPWSINSAIFTSGLGFVSGCIALPGFQFTAYSGSNFSGTTICAITNSNQFPVYSNVNATWSSSNNYLTGSCVISVLP